MNRHGWVLVSATMIGLTGAVHAQSSQSDQQGKPAQADQPAPPPPHRARAIRKSIIDLRAMARERRFGQVLPGDPTPLTSAVPGQAPANQPQSPAATSGVRVEPGPPDGPIDLPESVMARKPVINAPAPEQGPSTPQPLTSAPAPAPARDAEPAPAQPNVQVVPVAPAAPEAVAVPAPAQPAVAEPVVAASPVVPAPPAAPTLDGVILTAAEPSLGAAPADVRVERRVGGVQWRNADAPGSAWQSPSASDRISGRIEVRAGIDAEAEFIVDERVVVRVTRLGRAIIERSNERVGSSSVSVTLARGAIEVRSLNTPAEPALIARIKTPDQSFAIAGALRVEYDAFAGTRRRIVNP